MDAGEGCIITLKVSQVSGHAILKGDAMNDFAP
jgi:hypothetical protein